MKEKYPSLTTRPTSDIKKTLKKKAQKKDDNEKKKKESVTKDILPHVLKNAYEDSLERKTEFRRRLQRASNFNLPDSDDDYEENNASSESPIMDMYINSCGEGAIHALIGIYQSDFDSLWELVGIRIASAYKNERGPSAKYLPKDAFFFLLQCLHDPTSMRKQASIHGAVKNTFEGTVFRVRFDYCYIITWI